MLRLHGSRTLKLLDDQGEVREKLEPTAWLLDCIFFPAQADTYPIFRIEDSAVLDIVGMDHSNKNRRDDYSYVDLRPVRDNIIAKAAEYEEIEAKDRNYLQTQMVALSNNIVEYEVLRHAWSSLGWTEQITDPGLQSLVGTNTLRVSDMVEKGALLQAAFTMKYQDETQTTREIERDPLVTMLTRLKHLIGHGAKPWIPAQDPAEPEWRSIGDVIETSVLSQHLQPVDERGLALIRLAEAAYDNRGSSEAFAASLQRMQQSSAEWATERGEYGKIEAEVAFYQHDWFTRALALFIATFVMCSFSWMFPQTVTLHRIAWAFGIIATVLVVWGITERCILRGRPPVTTLYETILFISGTGAIVLLVTEWLSKQRLALALLGPIGAFGMFLAMSYERGDGKDTMGALVAVLDSNFWLATHVVTVTLGYTAGLMASFLAKVLIVAKLINRYPEKMRKSLPRMIYGVVAFGLVFSVVGTILGGIWANDSWGRFWGWDPKENGALMICLLMISMLHARMSGMIKPLGFAVASVFLGMVVAFSWWHVNLLGVGLHSYGFTSGVKQSLMVFYAIELVFIIPGLAMMTADYIRRRRKLDMNNQQSASSGSPSSQAPSSTATTAMPRDTASTSGSL